MQSTVAILLVLVPLLPLLGALFTVILGRWLGPRAHVPAVIGIGGALIPAGTLLALMLLTVGMVSDGRSDVARPIEVIAPLWQWASVDDARSDDLPTSAEGIGVPVAPGAAVNGGTFSIPIALRIDPLTATLLVIITGVGLLVAIYSIGYMHDDPGYPRFFALVAMFVFSMSMLVTASNFLLVYVFWEAVGACSYLLIGFWYTKPEAARAAKKAFLVNRVGDFGLAIATFLLWMTYGTLDFHDTHLADGTIVEGILGQIRLADEAGYVGGAVGTAICLLMLLAACGKSAQMPLHVWLPDAMEGPTPASALIHAATMVTAGIYLITRSAPLFVACPGALTMVSIVGATTALVAALIATVQNDLKRVLAYSTISQLGYMFVALGTGTMLGFTAAIFHLVTHAFFKALLFLGAGSVMHAMGGVIDMRRFGGLRHVMPITAATFLVGACALAGVAPFAGFFSKDEILATLHAKAHPDAHASDHAEAGVAGQPLWDPSVHAGVAESVPSRPFRPASMTTRSSPTAAAGEHVSTAEKVGLDALDHPSTWRLLFWMSLLTAGLTAFYTFRAVFMTFTGPVRVPKEAGHHAHESPSVMTTPLLALAFLSAFAGLFLFVTNILSTFLASTPSLTAPAVSRTAVPHVFHWDIAIQGTLAAAIGIAVAAIGHLGRRSDSPQMERYLGPLGTLFANKFYFDQIYAALIVRPLEALSLVTAFFDRAIVDGTVDAIGQVPLTWGSAIRRMQSGLVQRYALAGVVGVLAIVLALAWQLRP